MMPSSSVDPFHALADASRRAILRLVANDQLTINEVAGNFDMSRPAVSKHIRILYDAGFLTITQKGRERYCILNHAGFGVLKEWMAYFDGFWSQKLGALESHLDAAYGREKPGDKK